MSDLLDCDAGNAAVAERSDRSRPSGSASDAELIRRFVRTRDEQAFVELERRFGPLVRGVCARALDRNEDREDVYQATFLTLFLKAGKIRRRNSAACWLYGVAYRIASRLRRKRRLERIELAVEPAASDQEMWVDIDRKYLSEVLDAEMQALPTSDRLPLAMHYLMGLTHQEIGQSLGLSASAVDGRLKRARQRLRTRLLSRGIGLASALAFLTTACRQAQAASSTAEGAARGYELFELFDGVAETSSVSSGAQGLYAEEASMIAIGWGKSAAVIGGVALACGGLVGVFWQGSFGPGVAQAQMGGGGFGGGIGYGVDGFGNPLPAPAGPVVTVRLAGDQPPPQEGDAPFFTPLSETPATRKALSQVTKMDFLDQPLGTVLEAIEVQSGVEFQVDLAGIQNAGESVDNELTLQAESMTLADVLDTILEPRNLTYVTKDRYILITSYNDALSHTETRMYAIADHPLLRNADGNSLVNAIIGHVEPDSWSLGGGGDGTVSLLPGVLIVTNHPKTLDKVEDFLAQYGKLLSKYQPAGQGGMESMMGGYGSMGAEMGGSPYGSSGSAPGMRGVFGAAAHPYGASGGFGGQGGFGGGPGVEEENAGEAGGAEGVGGRAAGAEEGYGSPFGLPGAEGGATPGTAPPQEEGSGSGIPGFPGAAGGAPGAGLPGGGGIGGPSPNAPTAGGQGISGGAGLFGGR